MGFQKEDCSEASEKLKSTKMIIKKSTVAAVICVIIFLVSCFLMDISKVYCKKANQSKDKGIKKIQIRKKFHYVNKN